ncbi:MAG: thioredoxin family protein, partial [Muribaculaceae bacterium]|nr:thioredoxin family protein [Muribaculaceae bacterium]
MKNKILPLAAAFTLIITSCGGSESKSSDSMAAQESVQNEKTVSTDTNLAINGLPVVVDFSAEWCPPCRQLKPIFTQLKEEYAGKVDFITVNVDSMPDLSNEYRISSIPALIYISSEGKEVYRSIGFQDASQIKADLSLIP